MTALNYVIDLAKQSLSVSSRGRFRMFNGTLFNNNFWIIVRHEIWWKTWWYQYNFQVYNLNLIGKGFVELGTYIETLRGLSSERTIISSILLQN